MFKILKQLKYLKYLHLLLFSLHACEAAQFQPNEQNTNPPIYTQPQYVPDGFAGQQPQVAPMYPAMNQMQPSQTAPQPQQFQQMQPQPQPQPQPDQIDPATQPQLDQPHHHHHKHHHGVKIDHKALNGFKNVGHALEDVAASGALGPEAQGIAIAVKSTEAVINAAAHGESAEQSLKAGAKTAIGTILENSSMGKLAVMAASSAGVPVGTVTGGLVSADQGNMGPSPGKQLIHDTEMKVANVAMKEAAQHGAPVPDAAISATEPSGGSHESNSVINQAANPVMGPNEPAPVNQAGSDPANQPGSAQGNQSGPDTLTPNGPDQVNTQNQAPVNPNGPDPLNSNGPTPINAQNQDQGNPNGPDQGNPNGPDQGNTQNQGPPTNTQSQDQPQVQTQVYQQPQPETQMNQQPPPQAQYNQQPQIQTQPQMNYASTMVST